MDIQMLTALVNMNKDMVHAIQDMSERIAIVLSQVKRSKIRSYSAGFSLTSSIDVMKSLFANPC